MKTIAKAGRHATRPRLSRAAWLTEIGQWRESGQTADEYARARGLLPKTLKLRASSLRHELPRPGTSLAVATPGFLPVRVVNAPRRGQKRAAPLAGEFEVVLTNGRRIRVSGAFAPDALMRLLDAVEGGHRC